MQINAASLLAAQQARAQPAPQRVAAKTSGELFEPLFGKAGERPAATSASVQPNSAAAMVRPGSQVDIRV
jgi:hypothetical protein